MSRQPRGDRDGPAQAVGDDRGDGRPTRRSWAAAGSAPTPTGCRAMLDVRPAVAGPGLGDRGLQRASAGTSRIRLLADGEQVVDVPPKLSARARVFATGQGRKTDATDAHSVALVGTRMTGLRPVVDDEQLAVLRILVDRRRSLGEDHTRMVSQLHQLLLELIPGGAKKDLSAAQAKALLATVRPRDVAGKTRTPGRRRADRRPRADLRPQEGREQGTERAARRDRHQR